MPNCEGCFYREGCDHKPDNCDATTFDFGIEAVAHMAGLEAASYVQSDNIGNYS